MKLSKIQRVKKLCKWLIYAGYAENESGLSEVLGYTKSSFSQFLNEKKPLTDKFLTKICELDERVNKDYIIDGYGDFLTTESIEKTEELRQTIENQQDLINFQKQEIKRFQEEIKSQQSDYNLAAEESTDLKKKK